MNIGVSLTTFNRLEYLKKAILAYSKQTLKPDYIIIVNNGSSDGTLEYLKSWLVIDEGFEKIVINSETNTGGSGGFYQGLKKAEELDAEWVLVSDDDAYPERNMIENVAKYISAGDSVNNISAICASVIYSQDDKTSPHIIRQERGLLKIKTHRVGEEEYSKPCFDVDTITFVGAFINIQAMKKSGLPEKDYFIYHDDSEFAIRLRKYGRFVCIPLARIYHDCKNSSEIRGTWKAYYELRNRILMYKKHLPSRYWKWLIIDQYIKRISILAIFLKKYSKEERKLYRAAISDGLHNQKGLHKIYKP